jgi:CheY-like chemotaxis protein
MFEKAQPVIFLMAEDDDDDRLLVTEAFRESRMANSLNFVTDGVELLQYLRGQGNYADPVSFPTPDVILLDLNMPRKDGREALAEIKADPELRNIPVVVLTTSKSEEDVEHTYDMGVAGYITKPTTFAKLVEVVRVLGKYWFETATLPNDDAKKNPSPPPPPTTLKP